MRWKGESMLKQAILFQEKLKEKYIQAMCDDYFKFFTGNSYYEFEFEISKNDWSNIERVSVNSNGEIIGYFYVGINRDTRNITSFGIMNFTKKPNMIFAKDLIKFLRELRDSYNANKFEFLAYVGSPAEKFYREFIAKYGGNVVGIKRKTNKLTDGQYYDATMFEIMREDMKF
jgi:hypothetical protein